MKTLPQIKSNLKSMKSDAAKKAVNAAVKSQIRTAMKKAIAAANSDEKDAVLRNAVSVIDTAASKALFIKIMLPIRNPV